jgi:hypothetical protein
VGNPRAASVDIEVLSVLNLGARSVGNRGAVDLGDL